jgi:hypothetical protein
MKRMSNIGQSTAKRRKYNSHADAREANRIKARIRGKVVRNNKPVLLPQYLFVREDSGSKDWEAEGLTDMRARLRIHHTICSNEVNDNRHDPTNYNQFVTSLAEWFYSVQLYQNSWVRPHPMRACTIGLHCPVLNPLHIPS